jgi:hypothetical protein
MQIEIDFDVFKALTALRESERDTYNSVLRRLLRLPRITPENALLRLAQGASEAQPNALASATSENPVRNRNALLEALDGAWFGNVHFAEGTQFRATYKGQTYFAEIRDGRWVGRDGVVRTSPSDAASAISGTNVNGWRFWFARTPGDQNWVRMDEFKR